MGLGNLDVKDREEPGPPDLLVAVEAVIVRHSPMTRSTGWDEQWACQACNAWLSPSEARTHTAQKLWEAQYLRFP